MIVVAGCGERSATPAPDTGLFSDVGVDSTPPPPELPPPCPKLPCNSGEACVSTLAGSGVPGHVDGPVSQARFNFPSAIAVDSSGTVYVGDSGNDAVRVIKGGFVSTLPVKDATGSDPQFGRIRGMDVDSQGRVYLVDGKNLWVIHQGHATTIPTGGRILEPIDVAVGGDGAIYVVDHGNAGCLLFCNKVTRRPPHITRVHNGAFQELAGSYFMSQGEIKPDTSYPFASPQSVTIGADGTLYMPTSTGVRAIKDGKSMDHPIKPMSVTGGIAVDDQAVLYGTVRFGHRVGMLAKDGTLTTIPPLPAKPEQALTDKGCVDGPASRARFTFPPDLAVNPGGSRIYVADESNNRIRVIDL